jgi:serine/threonine protein phosphatase PrpC
LQPGDTMLLCSDGLHGALDTPAIRAVIEQQTDLELAARTLVTKALDAGSRDNVTALLIRYEAE